MNNEQLVALIRVGKDEANNMLTLWQQNKGFIYKMAMKYQSYAELEDLLQEGYLGLCEAVRHYDVGQDVPFINYAAFWIRQYMRHYIDNNSSSVRIPVHAREKVRELGKIIQKYRTEFNREPSDFALERLLGVSAEQLDQIRKIANSGKIRSLSEPLGEDDLTIGDTVQSDYDLEEDVSRRLDHEAMSEVLWHAVDELPEEQREVIRERFLTKKPLTELSDELGMNYNQIRNVEHKAIKYLRNPKRSKKYRAYFECYVSAASVHHVGLENFRRTWTSEVEREAIGCY